jgi:hypothetical protein
MPIEPQKLRQEWLGLGKDIHITTVDGKAVDGTFKGSDTQHFVLEAKGVLMIVSWSAVVTMEVAATPPQEYNARAPEKPKR